MNDNLIQLLIEEGWNVNIQTNATDQDAYPYAVSATSTHIAGKLIAVTAENNNLNAALQEIAQKAHAEQPLSQWETDREVYLTMAIYVPIGTDKSHDDTYYINKAHTKVGDALDAYNIIAGDVLTSEVQEN